MPKERWISHIGCDQTFLFLARYILIYFLILFIFAPFRLLSLDSYYYWEWSRHLDWGYYDGAGLIAYLIRIATGLLGNHAFALHCVSITSLAATTGILYKTARLFLNRESSLVAVSLWLFSPLVTLYLVKQTTYDAPMHFFWILVIYFAMRYFDEKQIRFIYATGISIGLLLLSKYSGIILVLALIIFLLSTSYRALFKSIHCYISILLALLIFSPVFIWNQQHDWISFTYQFTSHAFANPMPPWRHAFISLVKVILPALNILLIPTVIYWLKRPKLMVSREPKKMSKVALCQTISVTFLGFYLCAAFYAALRPSWMIAFLLSGSLIGGLVYQSLPYYRLMQSLIAIQIVISLIILINTNSYWELSKKGTFLDYQLMTRFNNAYPYPLKVVFTSGWMEARKLFFLRDKPMVYTLGCGGSAQNQYALWSEPILQQIKNKTLREAVYIDNRDESACLLRYFDRCERITSPGYHYRNQEALLYAYHCQNN